MNPQILKLSSLSLSAYCLVFSLSIALSQIFLALFVIFLIYALSQGSGFNFQAFRQDIKIVNQRNAQILKLFYYPACVWFGVAYLSSLFGLNVKDSLISLFKFSVYFILPYLILIYLQLDTRSFEQKIRKYIFLLFVGQCIAASHTIIGALIGQEINLRIPGPLTESGQISLLCPVLISFVYVAYLDRRNSSYNYLKMLIIGLLLFTALLINLKRGPWMSAFVTSFAFFSMFSLRRGMFVVALGLLVCFLPPVWQRLAEFSEHFFISGGRFDMWKLGFQLIERFPLGLGYGNSELIREFDSTLPLLHRHMHNNILNVTLETGLMGGVVYVWWFAYLLSGVYRLVHGQLKYVRKAEILTVDKLYLLLAFAFMLSILGFQIAGVVEYNFGDGEIKYLFLVLMGLMLGVLSQLVPSNPKPISDNKLE